MIVFLVGVLFSVSAFSDEDIIKVKSFQSVENTANRFEAVLKDKGMTIFIRINHAAGAKSVGETLRPTELVIFGNPKIGTKLMQCNQHIAIDLPLKALIYEDKAGQVWLSYKNPQHMARRHKIESCGEIIKKIESALAKFAKAATEK